MRPKTMVAIGFLVCLGAPSAAKEPTNGRRVGLRGFEFRFGMTVDQIKSRYPKCDLFDITPRASSSEARSFWFITNPEIRDKPGYKCPPDCFDIAGTLTFDRTGHLVGVQRSWGHWTAEQAPEVLAFVTSLSKLLKQVSGEGQHRALISLESNAGPEIDSNTITIRLLEDPATAVSLEVVELRVVGTSVQRFATLDEKIGPTE